MLRRTGFGRKTYTPPPPAPLRPLQRPVVLARISTQAQARPKEIKARKGKRAPTVAERAWMDAIVEFGCVACWIDGHASRPACVHHILRGGHRLGHLFTLPLCDPGHHQGGKPLGMISRHPDKTIFEAHYGTEIYLLNYLQRKLGFAIT